MKKYILFLISWLIFVCSSYSNESNNSFKVKIYYIDTSYKIDANYNIRSFIDSIKLEKDSQYKLIHTKNRLAGETTFCPELKLKPELYWEGNGLIFNNEWVKDNKQKSMKIIISIVSQVNDNYKIEFIASLDSLYIVNANITNQNKQFMMILIPAEFDANINDQGVMKKLIYSQHNLAWISFILEKHKNFIDTSKNRYWHNDKDSLIAFCDGNSIFNNEVTIFNAELFMKEGNNYIFIKSPKVIYNYNNEPDTLTIYKGSIERYNFDIKSVLPLMAISGDKIKIVKDKLPFTIIK